MSRVPENMLSVEDVGKHYGVQGQTVRYWIRNKYLPSMYYTDVYSTGRYHCYAISEKIFEDFPNGCSKASMEASEKEALPATSGSMNQVLIGEINSLRNRVAVLEKENTQMKKLLEAMEYLQMGFSILKDATK